jgi:hypothetical protein
MSPATRRDATQCEQIAVLPESAGARRTSTRRASGGRAERCFVCTRVRLDDHLD